MQALKHAEEAKQRANEKVIDVAVEETATTALSLTEPELALSELSNFEEELAAQFPILEEEINDAVSSINREENSTSINWDELDTRLAFLEENEATSQETQTKAIATETAAVASVSTDNPFVSPVMPLFPSLEELDNSRSSSSPSPNSNIETLEKTPNATPSENQTLFTEIDTISPPPENLPKETTFSSSPSELNWDNDLFDNVAPIETTSPLNFESNAIPNLDFGNLLTDSPSAQKAQNVFAATEQPHKIVLKKQARAINYRLYSLGLLLLVTAGIVFYGLNHSKVIEIWLETQGFIASSNVYPSPDKVAIIAPETAPEHNPPAPNPAPATTAPAAITATSPAPTTSTSTAENAKAATTWTDLSSAVRSALEHKLPNAETVVAPAPPAEVTIAPPKTKEAAAINSTPVIKQNLAPASTEEPAAVANTKKMPTTHLNAQANLPATNETAAAVPAAKTAANKNTAKSPPKSNLQEQRLFEQLQIAYRAFQRGDELAAYQNYQSVLQQLPSNRDALLGLAAIATQRGQTQQALQYYQKVLALYPEDSVAMTALVGLTGQQSPERAEAQLQSLIKTAPSAYVYYALGTLYTRQNRWQQAQQAFFDAWRLDKTQADYAYNLAVSLEYLKQSSAALPYYQQALQLLQQNPNNRPRFNPQQVQQRIQQLTP